MVIKKWIFLLLFVLQYKNVAGGHERIYTKIGNQRFQGIYAAPSASVKSVMECSVRCNRVPGCLGYNVWSPSENSFICSTFSSFTHIEASQGSSGWIDTCKVNICGVHNVACLNLLVYVNNTCACKEGFVNTKSGCQDECRMAGGDISIGKDCLSINKEELTWSGAKAACEAKGQHLVSPTSQQPLKDYVAKNYGKGESFWVSGTDSATEGTWVWLDGRPIQDVEESDKGSIENCLRAVSGDPYMDTKCSKKFPYICYIEP